MANTSQRRVSEPRQPLDHPGRATASILGWSAAPQHWTANIWVLLQGNVLRSLSHLPPPGGLSKQVKPSAAPCQQKHKALSFSDTVAVTTLTSLRPTVTLTVGTQTPRLVQRLHHSVLDPTHHPSLMSASQHRRRRGRGRRAEASPFTIHLRQVEIHLNSFRSVWDITAGLADHWKSPFKKPTTAQHFLDQGQSSLKESG